MARHYSTRNLFRQIPIAVLARYFHQQELFTGLDFGAIKATKPDELFDAWLYLYLPEEHRKPMNASCQEIFKLDSAMAFRQAGLLAASC